MTRGNDILQAFLGSLGLRLIRLRYDPVLYSFFFILKERGFVPKHIIDVGANHGYWTRAAVKYFPEAYYTLVEPQDHLRTDVQDLLARNYRIHWIGAGAGDKVGTMPFNISHRDDSSSFIFAGTRQIKVPVTTLNEIVRTSDAPFPDLVKIDAEGFDLRVLAGASELVGKTDIFLLEAAIGPQQHFENTLENVIQTMAHLGYTIFDIHDLNHGKGGGVLGSCEVAFLRNESHLLDGAYGPSI